MPRHSQGQVLEGRCINPVFHGLRQILDVVLITLQRVWNPSPDWQKPAPCAFLLAALLVTGYLNNTKENTIKNKSQLSVKVPTLNAGFHSIHMRLGVA